jgi:DNA-binding NarL/FixJ family response regulator
MPQRIRVLVVDPARGLVDSLARAVPSRAPVAIEGPAADETAAIDALSEGRAELVVVNLDRGDGRGLEVLARVAGAGSGRVLAASDRGGPDIAAAALGVGACGVLPEQRDGSLVETFHRALAGELVLPVEDLSLLVDRITSPDRVDANGANALRSLTRREREILQTLAAGASTADVAEAFGISPLTVQSHEKNILAKLGVHSKVEAVRIAWRHGLATTSRSAAGAG